MAQWVKGQSGNPTGRPKRELITHHLERELLQLADGTGTATKARKIAEKVIELAQNGNPWAVQFVAERTEGKPEQVVSIKREVNELPDDELNDIAAGSRDRTPEAQEGTQEPRAVH